MTVRTCSFRNKFRSFVSFSALFALGAGIALGGCGKPSASSSSQAPQLSDESMDPYKAVEPKGWVKLTMHANAALTHIDNTGHWDTNQNYCMQEASSALDMPSWNDFANLVNQALQTPEASHETCLDEFLCPIGRFGYNDKIVASLDDGTRRTLFEEKDTQMCTNIGDIQTARKLLKMLNQIAISADKQDCDKPYLRCGNFTG